MSSKFSLRPVPMPGVLWYVTYFAASVLAGFLFAAGCDWKPSPITPKPEPTVTLVPTAEPPESWCQAACARWQMAGCREGNDVCAQFGADGECSRWESCLTACEREPHAYPTGPCVANPPAGAGPMQTCEQVQNTCSQATAHGQLQSHLR